MRETLLRASIWRACSPIPSLCMGVQILLFGFEPRLGLKGYGTEKLLASRHEPREPGRGRRRSCVPECTLDVVGTDETGLFSAGMRRPFSRIMCAPSARGRFTGSPASSGRCGYKGSSQDTLQPNGSMAPRLARELKRVSRGDVATHAPFGRRAGRTRRAYSRRPFPGNAKVLSYPTRRIGFRCGRNGQLGLVIPTESPQFLLATYGRGGYFPDKR